MKENWVTVVCATVLAVLCVTATAQEAKPQSTCPIMGGKINKDSYVDVKGYRVYVCCPGCIGQIKADPDAALAKIKAKGETPDKAPVLLCLKCGQIKGTEVCCKAGQPACGGCGLAKGSPGCCKIPKDAKGEVALCVKCGQIKGTDACCKPQEGAKHGGCPLFKGSGRCPLGKKAES